MNNQYILEQPKGNIKHCLTSVIRPELVLYIPEMKS